MLIFYIFPKFNLFDDFKLLQPNEKARFLIIEILKNLRKTKITYNLSTNKERKLTNIHLIITIFYSKILNLAIINNLLSLKFFIKQKKL